MMCGDGPGQKRVILMEELEGRSAVDQLCHSHQALAIKQDSLPIDDAGEALDETVRRASLSVGQEVGYVRNTAYLHLPDGRGAAPGDRRADDGEIAPSVYERVPRNQRGVRDLLRYERE